MGSKTPFYQSHLDLGAKIVDFAGWDMPLHYGSQIQEHHNVRRSAGMFDVSHMAILDLDGRDALPFLRRLVANNVDRLRSPGQAQYSCMLNEHGGIIDDLVVYFLGEDRYRMVTNAGTRDSVLAWVRRQAGGFGMGIAERRDLAMIAVQGPEARGRSLALFKGGLRESAGGLARFAACWEGDLFVARTGYTGEDGFEIILPNDACVGFWDDLRQAGVLPAGLAARDTLRLEAGMDLYGADMDESTTPLECGLDWTVAWEPAGRDFVGRSTLENQRARGPARIQVGLVLLVKGVLRAHQIVDAAGLGSGIVTSGGFSPTLGKAIALARVPAGTAAEVSVEVRGRGLPARVVRPPFVRKGRSCLAGV